MTPYAAMLSDYMPAEFRPTFAYECRRYEKDPMLAFLLTLFGGLLGAGDFYLGYYVRGILMLLGTFSGIGALVTIPIWLYRCVNVWADVEAENDYMAYAIAYRYLATAANPTMPQPPPPPAPRARPQIGGLPVPVRSL
jgi:TM2 domain-containing membrane protein YozV